MRKRSLLLGLLFIPLICMGAEDAATIQKRMKERLPEIEAMKKAGTVGENNQGYLTVLKKPQADAAVVKAENDDRRSVYELIARDTGAAISTVGKRRAGQIARRSAPGILLQDEAGHWAPKP